MAVTNPQSLSGVMTVDSQIDLIDKAIEVLWMRRDEAFGVLGQFFATEDVASISTKVSNVGSALEMMRENEDTEEMPYVEPPPGYDQSVTLTNLRLAIRVTDTMIRADRFGKIVAMCGGLIKSAMRTLEYQRASIINGAFATTTTADSSYLCVATHPHEDVRAGTWSNLGSGALTGDNLQVLRLRGQNMTNEVGAPDPVTLKSLLVPTALEQKAKELTTATLVAEYSLNTPTVLIKNLPVVVSPHLSSTTAYFGFGDRLGPDRGLMEYYLLRPQLANVGNNPVDIPIDKRVKVICKMSAYSGKNIYGATGT